MRGCVNMDIRFMLRWLSMPHPAYAGRKNNLEVEKRGEY